MNKQTISLSDIELDKSFQPRDSLDGTHVNNLTEAYKDNIELPPITVWKEENLSFLLDGFHRYRAASNAGVKQLPVQYFTGSRAEAMAFAFKTNISHGLLLSRNERVKYLLRLLDIEPYKSMSTREAGKSLGVSNAFVSRLRNKDKPQGVTNVTVSCPPQQTSELSELKNEIKRLNSVIEQLMEENKQLRGATEQPSESSVPNVVDEDDPQNLCAPLEAAESLGIHINDVIRAINANQISTQKINGKVKVDINDVKQWRKNNE